jgi:hypothetical protein
MTPELVAAIAAVDPRTLAGRLLAHVVKVLPARGGAVLALQFGVVVLYADQLGGDLDKVAEAMATWQKRQGELAAGVAVQCGMAGSMSPLLSEGALVGAVFLDGVPVSRCDIREIATWLVAAITAPTPHAGAVEEIFRSVTVEGFERQKIVQLLEGHEWNVARVARIMGTTRRTIYQKMARYGIERLRVPRGRPRRPVPA